jgi:hypothetical protein
MTKHYWRPVVDDDDGEWQYADAYCPCDFEDFRQAQVVAESNNGYVKLIRDCDGKEECLMDLDSDGRVLGTLETREIQELKARDSILVDHMAEIMAKAEGNPEQPMSVSELCRSCVDELAKI